MFSEANPSRSRSTMKPRMPSLVRAQTMARCATCALVIHSLRPVITQPAPSRSAGVSMLPGSEPWFGSVSPKQPRTRPAAISGSQRSFCASEPIRWMAYMARLVCTETNDRRPESQASSSWQASPYARAPMPAQPGQPGQPGGIDEQRDNREEDVEQILLHPRAVAAAQGEEPFRSPGEKRAVENALDGVVGLCVPDNGDGKVALGRSAGLADRRHSFEDLRQMAARRPSPCTAFAARAAHTRKSRCARCVPRAGKEARLARERGPRRGQTASPAAQSIRCPDPAGA